jgi:hypothetical protein
VILPLRAVLENYPQPAGSLLVPERVESVVAQWQQGALGNMYWVNVLLALRARGDASMNLTVSSAELAEPRFGASVKTLSWCAATCSLAVLQVVEKGKTVPLIPVRQPALSLHTVECYPMVTSSAPYAFRCVLSQVLLRDGLKMENSTVRLRQQGYLYGWKLNFTRTCFLCR